MANKGRRMVFEEDIKRIGEGGGATYTAGDNINISAENVISATDTTYTAGDGITLDNGEFSANVKAGYGIVVDTDETDDSLVVMTDDDYVAYKNEVVKVRNLSFTSTPYDYEGETQLAKCQAWYNDIPVLQTNSFTDANTFGHTVISGDATLQRADLIFFKGTFMLRDTANNTNVIYTTFGSNNMNAATSYTESNFSGFYLFRSGNNGYSVVDARRHSDTGITYDDGGGIAAAYTACRFTRNATMPVFNLDSTKTADDGQSTSLIRTPKSKTNVNYSSQLQAPSAEGTYALQVTVDSDGYPTFAWTAVTNQ